MNWLNAFELMCYLITGMMLADLLRRRDWEGLYTFGSAALVGFTMELLAVAVTDIYEYNPGFWLSLGMPPKQFPFFGGLMWGALTVYGIRLAEKLRMGRMMTALTAGMLIVTMDLLLDVAAIRLDGGFWVWIGKPITWGIDQHTFLSVIWVNFLGYMIETPTVAWLVLRKRDRIAPSDWRRQLPHMLLIALLAILVTAAGSLIALGLNALTDDWFACIAFLLLWSVLLALILRRVCLMRPRMRLSRKPELPLALFWLAMYGYCLIALTALGLPQVHPWFFALGCAFALGTLGLCLGRAE